ncbi:FAD-linked oxidase [Bacillus mycoides]|uniref:FAD-linked oxidase n=1 Tax=Bacillus mycoides TaxID=1405 RepID=A0A1E8B975_BACMY|nr:FAD-linked oxidase [Bacillus mycoides]OFD81463.1 FAD-linked oxidase [Bacillus mycoides]OFD83754.1 FAD-linked oxidase [Bacillus mycoides]
MYELSYEGLTSEIITRYDCEYEEARQEWNRAIQKFPLSIIYCFTKWDVSNAIIWARKNEITIRIRSGGHHYEGYSVGNNVLVIDISKMNSMQLNEHKNTLVIQGGAQNKQIYDFISSKGYPFPGGTCPTVGVSGYTLGGGWGYSSRYFGLGYDNLIELR